MVLGGGEVGSRIRADLVGLLATRGSRRYSGGGGGPVRG